jgi:hypothetical protein
MTNDLLLAARVVERFVLAESQEPPLRAKAITNPELKDIGFQILVEVGKKHNLHIHGDPAHFTIEAPGTMKPKEVNALFEKVWMEAGEKARQEQIMGHRLSLMYKPKLVFEKYAPRDQSGKYMHSKWTRLCKCGHPVGIHSGEKGRDGSQPCFASDVGIKCDCEKFRPTSKFITDEEYDRVYKTAGLDPLAARVAACYSDRFEGMDNRGEVSVDSGSLLVIDPAYVKYWGTGEHPELSYDSVLEGGAPAKQLHFDNGRPAAVLIQNFGGDGGYPVHTESVSKDENGEMIGSFSVNFNPPSENTGEKLAVRVASRVFEAAKESARKRAARLERLRKSILGMRKKVRRDLQSSDPERMLTALAVALIDHVHAGDDGANSFRGWRKKHVSFGPKGAVIRGHAVSDPLIKKALRDAFEAADDDSSGLFAWEGGEVSVAKVAEYLEPYSLTPADIRGFNANQVLHDRLKQMRAAGDAKPTKKALKMEFQQALAETSNLVGHSMRRLRSEYLLNGIETAYLKNGTIKSAAVAVADAFVDPFGLDLP